MPVPIPLGGAPVPAPTDPRNYRRALDVNGHNMADPNDPWYSGQSHPGIGGYTFDPTINGGQWRYSESRNPVTGEDPNGVTGFDPVLGAITGANNNHLGDTAPGATLDTSQPDDERQRMQALLQQLQSQAQTGGGSWQGTLQQGLQGANSTAQSLAQSQPGLDRMSALSGMQNAQAGNEQRAAGQANILRAQSQQQAQGELADIYGAQGATDAQQAAQQAAARQGFREANVNITQGNNNVARNTVAGIGQGILKGVAMGGASDGGPVPGKPRVFGDSEANDTVPAMLSPGEVVIPRSVAQAPDAPARAAAFVAAVHAHKGHNFGDGGAVPAPAPRQADPWHPGNEQLATDSSVQAPLPTIFGTPLYGENASTYNGGLLRTGQYNQTRDAANANAGTLLASAAGQGPTVTGQQLQNSQDAALTQAMQGGAGMRGSGRAAGMANAIGAASQEAIVGAGKAADTRAQETDVAGRQAANALQRQRAQDLAFAQAQQQAAWRNSMMNSGIGLAQQAQLRGLLGGVGQGLAAGADMFSNLEQGGGNDTTGLTSDAFGSGGSTSGNPAGDFTYDEAGPAGFGGPMAHGGEVPMHPMEKRKASAFVKALATARPSSRGTP